MAYVIEEIAGFLKIEPELLFIKKHKEKGQESMLNLKFSDFIKKELTSRIAEESKAEDKNNMNMILFIETSDLGLGKYKRKMIYGSRVSMVKIEMGSLKKKKLRLFGTEFLVERRLGLYTF